MRPRNRRASHRPAEAGACRCRGVMFRPPTREDAMANGVFQVPAPRNEPPLSYAPGTPERAQLQARLEELSSREIEIPLLIGGREVRTGRVADVLVPHRHAQRLARWHQAGPAEVQAAIEAALEARRTWAAMEPHDRAAVLLRAADLLAGPWRQVLNAATMLGQSKTAPQAEIGRASCRERV